MFQIYIFLVKYSEENEIMCCGKQTNVQFIDDTCGVLKNYIK